MERNAAEHIYITNLLAQMELLSKCVTMFSSLQELVIKFFFRAGNIYKAT